jgi:hypothetical protein
MMLLLLLVTPLLVSVALPLACAGGPRNSNCTASTAHNPDGSAGGPCGPGHEQCCNTALGAACPPHPYQLPAAVFHLGNNQGCGENDPNGAHHQSNRTVAPVCLNLHFAHTGRYSRQRLTLMMHCFCCACTLQAPSMTLFMGCITSFSRITWGSASKVGLAGVTGPVAILSGARD